MTYQDFEKQMLQRAKQVNPNLFRCNNCNNCNNCEKAFLAGMKIYYILSKKELEKLKKQTEFKQLIINIFAKRENIDSLQNFVLSGVEKILKKL